MLPIFGVTIKATRRSASKCLQRIVYTYNCDIIACASVAASAAVLQVELFGVKYTTTIGISRIICLSECISHDTKTPAFLLTFTHTDSNLIRIHPNRFIFFSTFSFSSRFSAYCSRSLIHLNCQDMPLGCMGEGVISSPFHFIRFVDDIALHMCVCVRVFDTLIFIVFPVHA